MFQIEEDAFAYLNNVPDNQWKKQELEAQVAEKFEQKLIGGKQVITYPDVVDVLYQLGFSASDYQSTEAVGSGKRLYRRSENKVIGGVCSGLGDYFGIDPVVVRVFFALTLILGLMGFWLYIFSWIIIPKR
jgi:phage shock protein PspC (stress-responsive transcriptional regulator)